MRKKEIELEATLNSATLEGWYGLLFGMNRKSKERYILIKEKDLQKIIDYLNTQPQTEEYPQKAKYISGEVPKEVKDTPEEVDLIESFLKDFEAVAEDIRSKDYPDFIVGAEIQLFCWKIVAETDWSRTDLMQMINELEEKLKLTDK